MGLLTYGISSIWEFFFIGLLYRPNKIPIMGLLPFRIPPICDSSHVGLLLTGLHTFGNSEGRFQIKKDH